MLPPYTDRAQPAPYMTDRRWETRLLALLAAVLVVFGLTAVFGASRLLTTAGGQGGPVFVGGPGACAPGGGGTSAARGRPGHRWACGGRRAACRGGARFVACP